MTEDKRIFLPCPKCSSKNYEWDTMTADEDVGLWLYTVRCIKCGHIYSNRTELNKIPQQEDRKPNESLDMMRLAKNLLNPKALAKVAKETQKEMENDG